MKYNMLEWIGFVLVVVGAINWGLVGAFEFNLVDTLFGEGSLLSRLVYVLVGLAGVYTLYALNKPSVARTTNT